MKKCLAVLLLSVSLLRHSDGQEARYMVTNYDLQKHLSVNGSVWCMAQDTLGVLYFGIEGGIGTYDGTEWSRYGSATEVVRSLFADSSGDLWYGSVNDFGRVRRSRAEGLKLESIAATLPDSLRQFGDLWSIAEADSVLFFQSSNAVFTVSADDKVACYNVNDSYHRGFTCGGDYYINERGSGLMIFTGAGFSPANGGRFFSNSIISGWVELSTDTVLLGTREEGVFKWLPGSGEVLKFNFADSEADLFVRKNRIYHMTSLPDGNVAFASLLNGTLITDRAGRIQKILHYQSGIQDNAHYFLGLSHDNNLWMCTGNGISAFNIFSPFSNWDYSKGVEGVVMSIRSHMGGILVGTLTGLFFLPEPGASGKQVQRLLDSEVWDIYPLSPVNSRSRIVISAGNGLWLLDGMRMTNIFKSDLILKSITLRRDTSMLLSFGAGTLHISHVTDNSVARIMTMEGLFTEYRSSAQEADRYLWVGTRSLNMYRISQGALLRIINSKERMPAEAVSRFDFGTLTDVHNINGRIIFSNNEGFHSFDSLRVTFGPCTSLGPEAASYNKMVSNMTPDRQGNIWIGGNELLLNRQDGSYSLYLLPFDPVRDIFSAFVFYHETENRTWIGGNKGLYLYDRSVIDPADHTLPVIINRIVKGDSAVWVTALSCAGRHDESIALKNGRDISIFYSLPVYRGDTGREYSWNLEGYSDGWSRWSGQNFAAFNSLPPGSYLFRVRGRTLGHETADSCIRITISRPWYGSLAARLLYAAAILALLYLINSYSVGRRLKRELLIENIIQQRVQQSIARGILPGNPAPKKEDADGTTMQPDNERHSVTHITEDGNGRDKQFMNRLLDAIEENIDDCDLSVEKLCSIMTMSQTMLYRKLKAYTGLSITSFIRKVRLKKAAQLLLQTSLSVSEVAYRVGFNDPGYFSKCFREEFGQSPKSFQKMPRPDGSA